MILFPAIDLRNGRCVRLLRGDKDQATVYNALPAEQAREFENAGCEWLHVVDLDGAFAGRPANDAAIRDILDTVSIPVQLGGGIRDLETIERWLSLGVSRVILGTASVENPELVRRACRLAPGRIAIGIDARSGKVATRGWVMQTVVGATELARQFEDTGVAAVIYTDIDRDGALAGPNVGRTAALADSVAIPVIASGGIASLRDLEALRDCGAELAGAIAGRAIYDRAIDLKEALAVLKAPAPTRRTVTGC
ncbi:MAG: 1-(5-phosphoribosyl)-5-[(5-phosphoribosylamino)methylideneamino]imidazole-4-carboxamide isomerase [Paracoccaceae bacterium]|nr:1-(5-phosphoribosyl)-5-[(5-phosphoribosylamino)methylideneamino]imidazole-4-carboxamide isomerase [Paracoccaceae bacterium]